jgi:hypothetical protein
MMPSNERLIKINKEFIEATGYGRQSTQSMKKKRTTSHANSSQVILSKVLSLVYARPHIAKLDTIV